MVAEYFSVDKGTIKRIKSNRVAIQAHLDNVGVIPNIIMKCKHAEIVPRFEYPGLNTCNLREKEGYM